MKRDVTAQLKELRLHGMAGAWVDLVEQGTNAAMDTHPAPLAPRPHRGVEQ